MRAGGHQAELLGGIAHLTQFPVDALVRAGNRALQLADEAAQLLDRGRRPLEQRRSRLPAGADRGGELFTENIDLAVGAIGEHRRLAQRYRSGCTPR